MCTYYLVKVLRIYYVELLKLLDYVLATCYDNDSERRHAMTVSEMVRKLKKNGFRLKNHGKEHDTYRNDDTGAEVQIPRHPSKELKTGTANQILKDAGLK